MEPAEVHGNKGWLLPISPRACKTSCLGVEEQPLSQHPTSCLLELLGERKQEVLLTLNKLLCHPATRRTSGNCDCSWVGGDYSPSESQMCSPSVCRAWDAQMKPLASDSWESRDNGTSFLHCPMVISCGQKVSVPGGSSKCKGPEAGLCVL